MIEEEKEEKSNTCPKCRVYPLVRFDDGSYHCGNCKFETKSLDAIKNQNFLN
jgi:ribosomal protein L37AE/L43A